MVRELTIDTGKPFSKMSRAEMRKAVEPLKTYSEGAQAIKWADIADNVTMSFFTYSKNNKDFYRWWLMLLGEYMNIVWGYWEYSTSGERERVERLEESIAELKQFISVMEKRV